MKTVILLFLFAAAISAAQAQETAVDPASPAAAPSSSALGPEPLPESSVGVPPNIDLGEPSLIPKDLPQLEHNPGPSPEQAFIKSRTGAATNELEIRVKFREAMTKALQNPKLHELKEHAEAAATENEKRDLLRQYYEMLYAGVLRADSSVKKKVEEEKALSLSRLEQKRLRPLGSDLQMLGQE